ncbi:hypothetical protein LWI29_009995 [Acer saccharum]|uniref:F-box domain-containing protein n=1 Tax=Acer saccharum TaxID=4024 RepID=A0AA39W0S9_ACESA|nr:hypothetical protein LWI29_009995 [Acer saccharum]
MNKHVSKQDWRAYLSNDIVRLIMEKLHWKDKIVSSLVCKSWKQVLDEIKEQDIEEYLPWVMCFNWDKKSDDGGNTFNFKLCDPNKQTSYNIVKEHPERHLFLDAKLHASRCGWLLFSKHIYDHNIIFFFYSPFKNQIIKFPELEDSDHHDQINSKASFSLDPTSPDCMVVALSTTQLEKLNIKTCCVGDKSWKIFEFEFNRDYVGNFIWDVAYAGEYFYCLFSDKRLGAFNIKQQEWKVFPVQLPTRCDSLCVALNGDVTIAYLLPTSSNFNLQWRFCRFDSLEEKLINEDYEVMEKQVMFLGCKNYPGRKNYLGSPTSFLVPAAGNARESAGKVFIFGCYTRHISSCFMFNISFSREPSKFYDWIFEGDKLPKIWIHPPFITSKHKELSCY